MSARFPSIRSKALIRNSIPRRGGNRDREAQDLGVLGQAARPCLSQQNARVVTSGKCLPLRQFAESEAVQETVARSLLVEPQGPGKGYPGRGHEPREQSLASLPPRSNNQAVGVDRHVLKCSRKPGTIFRYCPQVSGNEIRIQRTGPLSNSAIGTRPSILSVDELRRCVRLFSEWQI